MAPLQHIKPILYDDWSQRNGLIHTYPHPNLDIEMCYEVIPENEALLFEVDGEWFEEGVNNPALSLENNWNEREWLMPSFLGN